MGACGRSTAVLLEIIQLLARRRDRHFAAHDTPVGGRLGRAAPGRGDERAAGLRWRYWPRREPCHPFLTVTAWDAADDQPMNQQLRVYASMPPPLPWHGFLRSTSWPYPRGLDAPRLAPSALRRGRRSSSPRRCSANGQKATKDAADRHDLPLDSPGEERVELSDCSHATATVGHNDQAFA